MSRWRRSLAVYSDRRVLLILPLGFASGLPLLLTFSTLSAWLATAGVSRAAIGAFALVGTPYAFKFLWSPLIDRLPPPLPLGRRRGWGLTIQIALVAAMLSAGLVRPPQPARHDGRVGSAGGVSLRQSGHRDRRVAGRNPAPEQQGPGAGMIQTGYRVAMLVAGAGALMIAAHAGWFAAYATMAALMSIGMLVFLLGPEPAPPPETANRSRGGLEALRQWLTTAVVGPFADFIRRPGWLAILIFVLGYKLGEAMAGVMAMPLYVALGFSLTEIAAISKLVGFFATIIGAIAGGLLTVRLGIVRALIVCGVLQSAAICSTCCRR